MKTWHGLNYPSDVRENDASAPWNAVDVFTCDHCHAEWAAGGQIEPTTAHGRENGLCGDCETYIASCAQCGEYFETAADPSTRGLVCGECVEYENTAACGDCKTPHATDTIGTVCQVCGRGVIRAAEKGTK